MAQALTSSSGNVPVEVTRDCLCCSLEGVCVRIDSEPEVLLS